MDRNGKMIQKILVGILEKDISDDTDLWPSVRDQVMVKPRNLQIKFPLVYRWASFGLLIILFFVIFISFTDPGRAIAQQISNLFTRTSSDSFQLTNQEAEMLDARNNPPDEFLLPLVAAETSQKIPPDFSVAGCEDAAAYITYACIIQRAEKEAGFDLFEFANLPSGWKFNKVNVTPGISRASMHFISERAELFFEQGLGEFPESYFRWEIVPEESVEVVDLAGKSAEYVKGWFFADLSKMAATWQTDGSPQRLAWRDGQRWFEINLWSGPAISKEWLINLAASLVETADLTQTSGQIDNTEIAEMIADFDLKIPGRLPLGVQFTNAKIDQQTSTVTLEFGGQAGLIINETLASNRELMNLAATDPQAQKVMIDENPGYLLTQPGDKYVGAPGPFGKMNFFLIWEDAGIVYDISFQKYEIFGGVITAEDMVVIAESLQDGHLYAQSDLKTPYSWLPEYEKLIGFDAVEIQQSGVQFVAVQGIPNDQAILIVYEDPTDGGTIFLYQGQGASIKDAEWANIPDEFIEKMAIGESGELVKGIAVANDWNVDAPYIRLRWKSNDRWFDMTASYEARKDLDQDRLIDLARSLSAE